MIAKRFLILFIAALLLVPLHAYSADPGVTDTEIVLGVTQPLTGPAAGWGIPITAGMEAWTDYINEQGGIHGRKIKLIIKDDGYNPARAVANLQQMKNKVFAIVAQLGSAPCSAAKDFYPENGIPLITAYGSLDIYKHQSKAKQKYYFVSYPDYEDETHYMTYFALNKLGVKKIAHFYQNDEYGLGANAGLKKALKENPGRAELVAEVPYDVTERALGTHALKLKESGADVVMLTTSISHAAIITGEMAKVGFTPKKMANFPLMTNLMFKLVGDLWNGTYVNLPAHISLPGVHPEADKVMDILIPRNAKCAKDKNLALFGAVSMMHFVEGAKNAGKNLTRKSLIKGMEMIKDWKPEGMGAPVTYTANRHNGLNGIWPMQARDGKYVLISDWYAIFKPHF